MTLSAVSTLAVRVLLFASYAEALGREAFTLELPAPATVGGLLERLRGLAGGRALPERPLVAVNLRHARPETPLAEGDEVAILPPLAGG